MASGRHDEGFTLMEVLVATALVVIGVVSVASLFAVSIRLIADARDRTIETALVVQKIEQVASARLGSLIISPANSLEVDAPGFVERVDARGDPVDQETGTARVFVRRWAIRPAVEDAGLPLVIRVLVATPAELSRSSAISAGVLLTTTRSQEID